MTKSKRTSPTPVAAETPRHVLYSRRVSVAGVSAKGSVESRSGVQVSVAADSVSNGVRSANSVCSVSVDRIVASASCRVESAFGSVASAYGHVPPSPKITLASVIKHIKRAAAGVQSQRIRQRLAQIQGLRQFGRVASVSSGQRELSHPVQLRGVRVASVSSSRCVKHSSVRPTGSVS